MKMKSSEKKVFAEGVCLKKAFWVFLFGCLFGTFWEMFLHFIKYGTLVSRSALIYGPLNPVYGLGAVIFMVFLVRYKNPIKIFLGGMLLGGGFEYFCSLIQEKVFGTTSWNYSNNFLNIQGRTSLFYMIFWGILAVVFVKSMYPFISSYVESIPINVGYLVTLLLTIFIVVDVFVSIFACIREKERSLGIGPNNKIDLFLDKHYPDERLDKIYENTQRKKN